MKKKKNCFSKIFFSTQISPSHFWLPLSLAPPSLIYRYDPNKMNDNLFPSMIGNFRNKTPPLPHLSEGEDTIQSLKTVSLARVFWKELELFVRIRSTLGLPLTAQHVASYAKIVISKRLQNLSSLLFPCQQELTSVLKP